MSEFDNISITRRETLAHYRLNGLCEREMVSDLGDLAQYDANSVIAALDWIEAGKAYGA